METSDTETHVVVVVDHKKLSHQLSFENNNFENEEEEDSYGIQKLFQIESPKKIEQGENKDEDISIEVANVEDTNVDGLVLSIENIESEKQDQCSKEIDKIKEGENENEDGNKNEEENNIFSIDISLFADENSLKILVLDSEPGYRISAFDINGDSITECQICFSTLNNQSVAFCMDCHYEVCFDCLSSHIEYQVKEGVVEITCPGDESCIKSFSDQFIAAFSSEHINSLLIKNKVEAEQNPNVKTCPGCHKIERKDENVKNNNKKNLARINCSCGTEWCFDCYSPWHSGLSCAKYQRDVVQHGDKALRYWAKSKKKGNCNNAKRCPKCHFYIERISGCNHMTCNRFDITFIHFEFQLLLLEICLPIF